MLGLTLNDLLLRLVAMLAVTGLIGPFTALAARLAGDPGPAQDGRLTPNPFQHLDFLAVIPFVLFQTGWIRPLEADPHMLRPKPPLLGAAAVLLAALLALVVVAGLLWNMRLIVQLTLPDAAAVSLVTASLRHILEAALWFALLNLIPVPPLLGGLLLHAAAPRAAKALARYSLIVGMAIIAILWTGWPQQLARPLYAALLGVIAPA